MDPYITLHHLFRRLQIKNRFIQQLPENSLSPLEVHLLIEVQALPIHTGTSLAKSLLVHQSTASRTIGALAERGLLRPADTKAVRNRVYQLTGKAAAILAEIDSVTEKRIVQWSSGLSKKEFERLVAFMGRIADGLSAPACAQRSRRAALSHRTAALDQSIRVAGR